jgi:hypothetical protein
MARGGVSYPPPQPTEIKLVKNRNKLTTEDTESTEGERCDAENPKPRGMRLHYLDPNRPCVNPVNLVN